MLPIVELEHNIEEYLRKALQLVVNEDPCLLYDESDIPERAAMFRVGLHLVPMVERHCAGLYVDMEYNRAIDEHGHNRPKRIPSAVDPEKDVNRTPDLVVHRRRSRTVDNLLIAEAKPFSTTPGSLAAQSEDQRKLVEYAKRHAYQHAVQILLSMKPTLCWVCHDRHRHDSSPVVVEIAESPR